MQAILAILSLLTFASARQARQPAHVPRQIVSNTTIVPTQANPVENPQTSFGAAAAAIQSAIAAGLQNSEPVTPATTSIILSVTPSVIAEVPSVVLASPMTVVQPIITTTAPAITLTQPIISLTTAVPAPTPVINTASVGSEGTVVVDGTLYTTTVVAAYVTVAASATTFYENGIAYVASYAGETITVTDCPCTRSAKIVFSTTTICNTCVSGTPVPASDTASGGPSIATVDGMPVVFTAGTSASSMLRTPVILSILTLLGSFFIL